MLISWVFALSILRLVPLLWLIRAALLLGAPGLWHRTSPLHELGVVGLWIYLYAVSLVTVNLPRVLGGHFEMAQNYNVLPLAGIADLIATGNVWYVLLNTVGNVLLFAPLGFLLPLLWQRWSGGRVVLGSLLLSSGIELLQLFTGRSADIDDVILNTLGGAVGFLAFCAARTAFPQGIARFRLRGGAAQKAPAPRRRVHRAAFATATAMLCMLVSAALLLGGTGSGDALTSRSVSAPTGPLPKVAVTAQSALHPPALHSRNILLASADLSEIWLEVRADERIYPASLTKMMTVLLALERIDALEETVLLREEIFPQIYDQNLSTAGFLPGEAVRAIDLIYGAMLPSGAECSVALAEHIAGSEKAFAALMNEKAAALGMDGTRFVNATGAHHRGHYTTAVDMALLLSYALENPTFRAIAATERYSTPPTHLHPDGITFTSTLLGRAGDTGFSGGALVGGKTGYTDQAGQCLASFAEIGGRAYLLITAGALPEDFRVEQLHIEDALVLYAVLGESAAADVL